MACETIEDEVRAALARHRLDHPVVWLEGGLHNNPDRLRGRVQEILDSLRCRRLLICLGYCGGGLSGLATGDYETVLPLADDCLSLLLGSMDARRLASRPVTYFLTAGWMRHENNIVSSYNHAVERFGQRQAERINRLMLKHYRRIGMVTTGCYDVDAAAAQIAPLASILGLDVETLPGDMDWLGDLLTGNHSDPERFLVMPPGSAITFDQWCPLLMGDPISPPGQLAAPAQIPVAP